VGGVPGPGAHPPRAAVDLPGAGLNRGKRVGNAAAEVLMAVKADLGVWLDGGEDGLDAV
jgi:hypothetical protein